MLHLSLRSGAGLTNVSEKFLLFFDAEERLVQVVNFALWRDAGERESVVAAGKLSGWNFEDEPRAGFGAVRPDVRSREDFRATDSSQGDAVARIGVIL